MNALKKTIYTLDDGTKTPNRSEYMRQEFMKGRTRKEIAVELNIKPGIVAVATANMDNGKLKKRSRVFLKLSDGTTVLRADYIRQEVIGKQRQVKDVAKELGIEYVTAYAAVRGMKGIPKGTHGGKVYLKLSDGSTIGRVEYIKQEFAKGKTRRAIAEEIDCDYQIVYATTYKKKEKA